MIILITEWDVYPIMEREGEATHIHFGEKIMKELNIKLIGEVRSVCSECLVKQQYHLIEYSKLQL